MSTTKIHVRLVKTQETIVVVYRNNALKRIEFGKIGKLALEKIGFAIPHRKSDLEHLIKQWKGRVEYSIEENQPTLHQDMVDSWHVFYEKFVGFPPKFNGIDGKALKEIREHLILIGGSPKEALILWKGILSMWKDLDKFHHKKTDLKYISSQLNSILGEIKTRTSSQLYQTTADSRYDL